MRKFIYILKLSFVFCIFSTCQKEGALVCTEKNTLQVASHAKDFFQFREGSWWVYEEEKSMRKDSVWISNLSERSQNYLKWKRQCNCGYGKCNQEIFITFENLQYNASNGTYPENRYYTLSLGASSYKPQTSYISFYGSYFYTYDMEYENGKPVNNYYWEITELPSYTVKGNSYSNVIHYKDTQNHRRKNIERWYAKNTYLIKYTMPDSTTWNLVNYHAIQ